MLRQFLNFASKPKGWRTLSSAVNQTEDVTQSNKTIFHELQVEFDDVSYVKNAIHNKKLKNTNIEEWRKCIGSLKTIKFEDAECFQIISRYPQVMNLPPEQLKSTLQTWLTIEMNFDCLKRVLYSQPVLLSAHTKEIEKRLPHLQVLFRNQDNLSDLLVRNPNVIFDDWIGVQNKINYLLEKKGIRTEKLVKSYALSKSLNFIMLRFDVAEKCGKFVRPTEHPHKRVKFDKTNNIGIKHLIDSTNAEFAKEVNISLEEYHACKDLSEENVYDYDNE